MYTRKRGECTINKHEFLQELSARLSQFPQGEREKAYAFYAEIIDDSMDDGFGEDEAIQRLGSMDEIIERIAAEVPMAALIQHKVRDQRHGLGTNILLILGFPLWFPILLTLACVALVLFLLFWMLDLLLWIVFGSMAAVLIGGCIGFFLNAEFGVRLFFLGFVMASAGGAMLLLPAALSVTRHFASITRKQWNQLKNIVLKAGTHR